MPAAFAALLDSPLRKRMQSPTTVVDWIGIKEGATILEIGPGPGTFTVEAASRAGKGLLFAVDIQPSILRTLYHNLLKVQTKNVIPLAASAYDLPFHNTFDRVFMVCVLGEIPDKEKALNEIKRVLKKDGLLAIGEFLPDPDYPPQKTVINWCHTAGFKVVDTYKGFLHYVITFKK